MAQPKWKFRYSAVRIIEHEKHGIGDVETTRIIERGEAFSCFGKKEMRFPCHLLERDVCVAPKKVKK